MVFCTLFDINYLERAMILYHSIAEHTDRFKLYMFTLDQQTYDVLERMTLSNVIVISEESLLQDEKLTQIKKSRTRTEYCWTCTPYIIEYVLDCYHEKVCTYIDADMCFFHNPNEIMQKIEKSGCSVSIIGHRFPGRITKRAREKISGKYCVEFNTFFNDSEGREVLSQWKEQCTESCTMNMYEEGFGDQKYLNEWLVKYNCIYEIEHLGYGVAPWNIRDYNLIEQNDSDTILRYKGREECILNFYHFQNITFFDHIVNIGVYSEVGFLDRKLIKLLYIDYLSKVLKVRQMLETEYHVRVKSAESRRGKGSWHYTDLNDLIYHILSLMTIALRYRKNRLKLSDLLYDIEKID